MESMLGPARVVIGLVPPVLAAPVGGGEQARWCASTSRTDAQAILRALQRRVVAAAAASPEGRWRAGQARTHDQGSNQGKPDRAPYRGPHGKPNGYFNGLGDSNGGKR